MSKITAGTYKAKIKDYGLVQGKTALQVKVTFAIEGGLDYAWYGQLGSEKSQEITTRNLVTMGATPSNIQDVEKGLSSGVLNTNKTFELVVADRTYAGKVYTEIKYINDPSLPRAGTQSYATGTGALGALKGTAAKIIAENGGKTTGSAANSEDVPF